MDNDKIEKIMQIMSDGKVKYYDDEINTTAMKTIKALVPYLNYEYQKQIGIAIKFIEIQMLMQIYDTKTNLKKENDFESAILNAMKIYINNDDAKILKDAMQLKAMQVGENIEKGDKMEDLFNDDAFKNLSDDNINLLKNFMHDIADKTPMEAMGIMMEYSKKMPQNLSAVQKDAIVQALLKKMPSEKRQQFLVLYNMFGKKNRIDS